MIRHGTQGLLPVFTDRLLTAVRSSSLPLASFQPKWFRTHGEAIAAWCTAFARRNPMQPCVHQADSLPGVASGWAGGARHRHDEPAAYLRSRKVLQQPLQTLGPLRSLPALENLLRPSRPVLCLDIYILYITCYILHIVCCIRAGNRLVVLNLAPLLLVANSRARIY